MIGGGTGGLSFAQEARKLGLNVILFDHVDETPNYLKNKWGLGGTCVNVGCIPKKLFHNSGIIKDTLKIASSYGWNLQV